MWLGVFLWAILYLCLRMYFFYDILVYLTAFFLRIMAYFDPKIRQFVNGRKATFKKISQVLHKEDKVIWMHCASLGEFEQGRPVIEALRNQFPEKKIILSFFSPSGYEVRKNYTVADVVCYLPLDTQSNCRKFIDLVQPELAIFVKYEFWPNMLRLLKRRAIKTLLISGIFRPEQAFFKWYGTFLKKSLKSFDRFFVQDSSSKDLLNKAGYQNVELSGDTRFDRVFAITDQDNTLDFMTTFKNESYTVVAGSTWKEDEALLISYINKKSTAHEKFVLAPHNMDREAITTIKKSINKSTVLYTERKNYDLKNCQVLILDTIGILTKVYSYADLAYVGGGFTKSGVHNVLEPATFGIPIVIGPNYYKFREVKDLVSLKACYSIDDSRKLSVILSKFYEDQTFRTETGSLSLNYVLNQKGATKKIIKYIKR